MLSTTQNNGKFEIGLNIHLLSFSLPKDLIKDREEVRVSITTIPELNKQHFTLHGKKMNCTNHVFTINITNETKNVVMVFRKKTFNKENPIIASKTIHLREYKNFPQEPITTGTLNSEVKQMNIYYPLQKQEQEAQSNYNGNDDTQNKRKILGSMQVQLSFTTPYLNTTKEKKNNKTKNNNHEQKTHKFNKKSSKNEYRKIDTQNESINYSLF